MTTSTQPITAPIMQAPDAAARFTREFIAGWGTMDFNGHMANTAYLDFAADARLAFFAQHGFPASEFRRLGIGPVIRRDEIEYFREIGLHERVTVTVSAAALSGDGARFVFENELWIGGGERAARVRSSGGWLDLRARKLVAPPDALRDVMRRAPRTADFVEMPPGAPGRARRDG